MFDLQDDLTRVWSDLMAGPSGPLGLRFLFQPAVAAIFGIRDGLKDARKGRSPYFWTVVSDPDLRRGRLREGLAAVGKVIFLAFALDTIYQFKVLGTFDAVEALIVAFILAFLPYLLIRGPVARIARRWYPQGTPSDRLR